MAKFEEIAKHPGYDAAASGASKATIFLFIATFTYLIFFSGTSPGIIGGTAFVVIGMFVVSIFISMPFFLLRCKLPSLSLPADIAHIAINIFVTRFVYLWLFSAPPVLANEPFVINCKQPIPEFTLGADSNPSKSQVAELCSCVWNKLGAWEKETARAISREQENSVSSVNLRAFPSRLGSAIRNCGGMDI